MVLPNLGPQHAFGKDLSNLKARVTKLESRNIFDTPDSNIGVPTYADLDALAAATGMSMGDLAVVAEGGAVFEYSGTQWIQQTRAYFGSWPDRDAAYAKASGAYLVDGATSGLGPLGAQRHYWQLYTNVGPGSSGWFSDQPGSYPIILSGVTLAGAGASGGADNYRGYAYATDATAISLNNIYPPAGVLGFRRRIRFMFKMVGGAADQIRFRLSLGGSPVAGSYTNVVFTQYQWSSGTSVFADSLASNDSFGITNVDATYIKGEMVFYASGGGEGGLTAGPISLFHSGTSTQTTLTSTAHQVTSTWAPAFDGLSFYTVGGTAFSAQFEITNDGQDS